MRQDQGDVSNRELALEHGATGDAGRSAADVTILLVELGRVAKSLSFYGSSNPTSAGLAERAYRAWHADLQRAGALELWIGSDGFSADGVRGRIAAHALDLLLRALRTAGIEHLRISQQVTRDAFVAFVETLPLEGAGEIETPPPQLGIEINGRALPIRTSALTLGLAAKEPQRGAQAIDHDSEPSEAAPPDAEFTAEAEAPPETPAPAIAAQNGDEKASIDQSPLEATPTLPDAVDLITRARELDACTQDSEYQRLAGELTDQIGALATAGHIQEAYRGILVLADHAADAADRSSVKVRFAAARLCELAEGRLLAEIIDRACSATTAVSVRAAQVLLQLGAQAGPQLLERLEASIGADRDDAAQLAGLLIAMGEATVPTIAKAIRTGRGERTRLAIRLAGELRCPDLVDPLRHILRENESEHLEDAARALVSIGNAAAVDALLDGLDSPHDRIAEVSAFWLGSLGAPQALPPLVERLDKASRNREWRVAREILRSIGQFREADARTATALRTWAQQSGAPWRRPNLELKLEAVTALGQLSDTASVDSLEAIADGRLRRVDNRLRERARQILDQRAKHDALDRTPGKTATNTETDGAESSEPLQ